jgi:hypothetical protein
VSPDRSERNAVNNNLAIIDFEVQRLLLAVADSKSELLEFDQDSREIVEVTNLNQRDSL